MEKEPVSVQNFEDGIKNASPMPLFKKSNKNPAYSYFKKLGKELSDSLKNGTSPLLPNKDGFVDLQPAYNVNTNTKLEGLTQIALLTKAAEIGAPSNAFVTFAAVKKAQEAGVDCKIAKDSKSVQVPIVDPKNWGEFKTDERTGEKISSAQFTWFNLSQVEGADKLLEFCKQQMTEKYEKDVAYINGKYPDSDYEAKKNPADRVMQKPNERVIPLNEQTAEPFQYIAQVLNAVQSGRKLYVTPEQAEAFRTQTIAKLDAEIEPGKPDILAIKKICDPAERLYLKSREAVKEYYQKKDSPEQEKTESAAKKPRTREPSYEIGM